MSAAAQLARPPVTAGYRRSGPAVLGWSLDSDQWFSVRDAEKMRRDPQVQAGLRMLCAPLYQVKVDVRCGDANAKTYIEQQYDRFWRRGVPKTLRTMLEFGFAPGEQLFGVADGKLHWKDLLDIHPFDAVPLERTSREHAGEFAGLRVNMGNGRRGSTRVEVGVRHAWWVANDPEFGNLYGRSRLAGAFMPWMEKRGRKGACDVRRLWYQKNAYSGGMLRYPPGDTVLPDGTINNQDLARQILEKYESGGALVLPSDMDGQGNFLWVYDPPKLNGELAGVLDYVERLDKEILLGLGIPPEVMQAEDTGSGYSGRAIPAQAFFASLDEIAGNLVETFDRMALNYLVKLNFGRVRYDVRPRSLVANVAREAKDAGTQDGGGGTGGDNADDPFAAMKQAASGDEVRMSLLDLSRLMRGGGRRSRLGTIGRVERARLSQARAPVGGVTIQGTHYPGGKFIPAAELAKATPEERAALDRDNDGEPESPAAQRRADRRALREKLPEEDRRGRRWAKIKKAAATIAYKAANTLSHVIAKAAIYAPDVLDTADDWLSIKMAKEYDPVLAATGIGANSMMIITSHVLSRALNAAGIRLAHETAAMHGPPDYDRLGSLAAVAVRAIIDAAGLPFAPPTAEEMGAALRKRIEAKGLQSPPASPSPA